MKKNSLLILILTIIFLPIMVMAKNEGPLEKSLTKYYKVIEKSTFVSDYSLLSKGSMEIEMSKQDFYKELEEAENNQSISPYDWQSDTTSYKTLTVSFFFVSGNTYKVGANVNWHLQMPVHRGYDYATVSYYSSTEIANEFHQNQEYLINGVWNKTSIWNSNIEDYAANQGVYTRQAITSENNGAVQAHNGRFNLVNDTNVKQIVNSVNFNVVGFLPNGKVCATIKHDNTDYSVPQNDLNIFLNSNLGNDFKITMGSKSGNYTAYESYYSSQTVCMN